METEVIVDKESGALIEKFPSKDPRKMLWEYTHSSNASGYRVFKNLFQKSLFIKIVSAKTSWGPTWKYLPMKQALA